MTTSSLSSTHQVHHSDTLTYRIPNTDLFINQKGEIFHSDKSKYMDTRTPSGRVSINVFGATEYLSPTWLYYVARFGIADPRVRQLRFVKIRSANAGYPVCVAGYIEAPWSIWVNGVEYRVVPRYYGLAVSCDGHCINFLKGNVPVAARTNHNGYLVSSFRRSSADILEDEYLVEPIRIHRLVAMVWCCNADYVYNNTVNHIDCDKQNNHYTNLEWCTDKDNFEHAIANNRIQAVPCRVRNRYTGKIIVVPSINALGPFLKIGNTALREAYFTEDKHKLYNNTYEVRIGDDMTPWYHTAKTFARDNNGGTAITVEDATGKQTIYYGISQLSVDYPLVSEGKSTYRALQLFRKHYKTQAKIVSTKSLWRKETITVISPDKTETSFTSAQKAAAFMGAAPTSLNSALRAGKIFYKNGYQARL